MNNPRAKTFQSQIPATTLYKNTLSRLFLFNLIFTFPLEP